MTTCDIPKEVVTRFKQWKLSQNYDRAFLLKINKETLAVEIEGEYEEVIDLEEWAAEYLPDNQPRFLVWVTKITSIENGFERINFPMCFIYWCPPSNLVQNSLYASTKGRMIEALEVLKIFDVHDPEHFTTEKVVALIRKR